MSDLISRSKLIKAFNNKNVQITFDLPVEEVLGEDVDLDDFAMLVQDAIQAYKKMVIDAIKNQQTAYSVDKVVEEIKTLKEEALGEYNMGEYNLDNNIGNSISENYRKDMNEGKCFAYDEAIEIVKQGGVRNNRKDCEYRHDNGNCLKVGGFCTSVDDKHCEKMSQGGVSDDVCEWKSDYGFVSDKYKRETRCGYTFYDLHHAVHFKYCPYCGKKIKVVD